MAYGSLLPNVFRALYDAIVPSTQSPSSSAVRKAPATQPKASTMPPQMRQKAIVEAARQKVATDRNAPSIIPVGVRDVGAGILSGINNGAFGLPALLASKLTGTPNDLMQEYVDEQGRRAPVTNFLATLGQGLLTGSAEAKAIGGLGGLAARSGAPVLARGGQLLRDATELRQGQKALNAARITGAGATGGATEAAIRDRNVAEGAALGAVAAPAAHLGIKGVVGASKGIQSLLGYAPVEDILTKYVKTPLADIQSEMDARAQEGLPSSIYEVLPLADRERLKDAVGKMPAGTRERLDSALSQRAQEIVGETATRVKQLTRPAVNPVRAEIAGDLASSRGSKAPSITEKRMAVKAVQDPTDMNTVMKAEAQNIMAPHDKTFAYESVDDLAPKHIDLVNGTPTEIHSNPEITSAIRDAAGKLNYRKPIEGITVGDVTGILSNLAKDATAADTVKARNARDAAEAVMDSLQRDHPDVASDVDRMRAQWRKRIETVDAMREGYKGRTRTQAGMQGMDAQDVRTAYNTPQGGEGRALGQSIGLNESLQTQPQKALGVMNEIESDPTAQRAISSNLGSNAGENIADIARMQTKSVRNLAGAQSQGESGQEDIGQVIQNLAMATLPQTMMHTKAMAVARLFHAVRIPEKQGNQIVDMLFSTDPANVARGIGIVRQAGERGEQALRSIAQDLAVGTAAQSAYQSNVPEAQVSDMQTPEEPTASAEPDYSKMSDEELLKVVQPESSGEPDYSKMSDENLLKQIGQQPQAQASPYEGASEAYSPEFQDLFNRVLGQESGHKQVDASGNPIQSSAGAIGIAQVMPKTAPKAAELAGLPWDEHAYYTDPHYNKALGAAYLNEMLRTFNGNPAMAVAAYNAGPGAVQRAVAKGQGNWTAYLPQETQGYLKAILQ